MNLEDVKIRNRSSILELIFRKGAISRKEIAARLGLTPAAITQIIGPMMKECLICETSVDSAHGRKGRREVMLQIPDDRFTALGVNITSSMCQTVCIDIRGNIVFADEFPIDSFCHRSEDILGAMCARILELLVYHGIREKYELVGVGISVVGSVDMEKGISENAYNVWERDVDVQSFVSRLLHTHVLVANNICALMCGDTFRRKEKYPARTLFVKYGPGIGGARYLSDYSQAVRNIVPVELGHIVMDPRGLPCVCGGRGCLETICGYFAIVQNASASMNQERTPLLVERSIARYGKITFQDFMDSFLAGEEPTTIVMDRIFYYMALAIRNTCLILDTETLVIYGEAFGARKARDLLLKEIKKFNLSSDILFSPYIPFQEAIGSASMAFYSFFERGGIVD